jgi:putative chitinase
MLTTIISAEPPAAVIFLQKFTPEVFSEVIPLCREDRRDECYRELTRVAVKYDLVSPRRFSAFLATIAHESNNFNADYEDLAYTPTRILKIWPNRFTREQAIEVASLGPEGIANRVYSSRLGNGDEASGDGWRFRGRGWIQLTGRENYRKFGSKLGIALTRYPDKAADINVAAEIAALYFIARVGWYKLDTGTFAEITHEVNGGLTDIAKRTKIFTDVLSIFMRSP